MQQASAAGPVVSAPGGAPGISRMAPNMVRRMVRSCLNKITMVRFNRIADRMLEIAAQSRDEADGRTLKQVVQLTLENAMDEADWAFMFAKLCERMLVTIDPNIKDESIIDRNGDAVAGSRLFRKYLLDSCQQEFERGWNENSHSQQRNKSGDVGTRKAILMCGGSYTAVVAKRRRLGIVQFIGELYKLGMVTERIMHSCVKKLVDYIDTGHEAEINTLTRLFKTIGSDLDGTAWGKLSMDIYFERLQAMIGTTELLSRLKFILMDIVDLRKAGWISREGNKGVQIFDDPSTGISRAKNSEIAVWSYGDSTAVGTHETIVEGRQNCEDPPKFPGLKRWILIEKIGQGAYGHVYRAKDRTGQMGDVAVKVVPKINMNSKQDVNVYGSNCRDRPEIEQRISILAEVQIMQQLDHPNIVKLVDFTESSHSYFIVLELCAGGEIFHQIARLWYFSENLSRHVIIQVAKALQYLHEVKGVVHRDIKPENILFVPTPFIPTRHPEPRVLRGKGKADEGEFVVEIGSGTIGQVKIADFGCSKVILENEAATPCGTMVYTAPEVVRKERYTKAIDSWALGCVLYTLLCGFPPFYDENVQIFTEKVVRGEYSFLSPWWDHVSKSAKDLVSQLLIVDPRKRFTIQQLLNHPWIVGTEE